MTDTTWKTCTKCGESKPVTFEFFYRFNGRGDGFRAQCKACSKADNGARKKAQRKTPVPVPVAEGMRRCSGCGDVKPATLEFFFSRNTRGRKPALSSRCKTCLAEREKARPPRPKPERTPELKAKVRASAREWRSKNPERSRELSRASYKRNPEATLRGGRKYRAVKKGATTERVTKQDYAALLAAQEGRCAYCRDVIAEGDLHWDHKVPLSRGGEHNRRNLCASCSACNLRKGAMTDGEYLALFPDGSKSSRHGD